MQTQGSLTATNLAALLQSMQSERATGTLTLQSGQVQCALYFLFGHLFHATADDDEQGEEVVIKALAWGDGNFTFDPRAKLPAEESIKAAPVDLIAEAEQRAASQPSANGSSAEASTKKAASDADGSKGRASKSAAAKEENSNMVGDQKSQVGAGFQDAAAAVPLNAFTADDTGMPRTSRTSASSLWESAAGEPASARVIQVFGNTSAAPLTELYPLPSGKPIYEKLKSAFVDFPKLLRTLRNDTHTGYVRLDGDNTAGVLLFHDGRLLDALFSEPNVGIAQGNQAFAKFRDQMEAGHGLLDVIELGGETVIALAELLTAQPLFTGLLGRFINFEALLDYLAEEKIDGSVIIENGKEEMGVILLRKGAVHGAYSRTDRELQSSVAPVATLAQARDSRIEVKSGAGDIVGIDIDSVLSQAV